MVDSHGVIYGSRRSEDPRLYAIAALRGLNANSSTACSEFLQSKTRGDFSTLS
jgi:hypothetical protein